MQFWSSKNELGGIKQILFTHKKVMVHAERNPTIWLQANTLFTVTSNPHADMAEQPYLHKKVHNISRHLLNKYLNDSQDLSFSPSKSGGVNILLRLRVRCEGSVSVHLPKSRVTGGDSHSLNILHLCLLLYACVTLRKPVLQNALLYFETYGLFLPPPLLIISRATNGYPWCSF